MNNLTIKISKSNLEDIDTILKLYTQASLFQQTKQSVCWGIIPRTLIEKEIDKGLQYKLTVDGKIAMIWVYTFNDPEIWKIDNNSTSIYMHRIAINPDFRGMNLISKVFEFTENYAKDLGLQLIRLDVAGFNPGLIKLYLRNCFKLFGTTKINSISNLPNHYKNVDICLFERKVNYNFLEKLYHKFIVKEAESNLMFLK